MYPPRHCNQATVTTRQALMFKGEMFRRCTRPTVGYKIHSSHRHLRPLTSVFMKYRQEVNILYEEMKPILMSLRTIGVLPYSISSTGKMEFKFVSPATIYSLIVHIIITVGVTFREEHIISNITKEDPFESRVWLYIGAMAYVTSVILVPLTHWPEVRKKVKFVNDWGSFQTTFSGVTGKPLVLGLRKKCWIWLLTMSVYNVIQDIPFLLGISLHEVWWVVPLFFFSTFFVNVMAIPWILLCSALRTTAKRVADEMELHVSVCGFGKGDKVAEYKELWLQLNRLTRSFGKSMGLTFGGHILSFFTGQVLFTYHTLSILSSGSTNVAAKSFLPIVFTVYIFALCNAAHKVTEEVGVHFQNRLQMLESKFPANKRQGDSEIQRFYTVIARHPPIITFCGFADANRGLQMSLMSALVTYMVVLIQFNMGSREATPYNCTNKTLHIS